MFLGVNAGSLKENCTVAFPDHIASTLRSCSRWWHHTCSWQFRRGLWPRLRVGVVPRHAQGHAGQRHPTRGSPVADGIDHLGALEAQPLGEPAGMQVHLACGAGSIHGRCHGRLISSVRTQVPRCPGGIASMSSWGTIASTMGVRSHWLLGHTPWG